MAKREQHSQREAKKPKKAKPKESMPASGFASISKKGGDAVRPEKK